MQRNTKLRTAKIAVVLSAIPFLLWAHEYGPDVGYNGVPKENGTCASAGCHVGSANNPSNKGSIAVAFPNGATYTPGVKQHWKVTITDSTQIAWGFQLTTRSASASGTMAGALTSSDKNTLLMCADATANPASEQEFDFGSAQSCPAARPLGYIEHSLAGYTATRGQKGSGTYEFDWTPPATNIGNITVYVAGNAANGDLTVNGDHIYVTTFTLTPVTAAPPSISANGVLSAGSFGGFSAIAPGSWIEIYGTNLSTTTREWAGSDFSGANAPTSLDGVSVTVGGQAAFIRYISPGQINVEVASATPSGAQPVVVTNAGGASPAYNIQVNSLEPGLLAPSSFSVNSKQYVVAQFNDGSYVLPAGAISGLTTRAAKPGETIVIYGIGFGPVLSTANQSIPAGQICSAANTVVNSMAMQIGGAPATLVYDGLAPNFVGLYQFNVTVPNVADGDQPLTYTLNGAKGPQTLTIAVHQ